MTYFVAPIEYYDDEDKLFKFTLDCQRAREVNKRICTKHRIDVRGLFEMTPEEELFKKYYNEGALAIQDMDDLQLRAHIESLREITFRGRVYLRAAHDLEEDRNKKSRRTGGGFIASVETDDATSDAINTIKTRQEKLSKEERQIQNMIKNGIPEEYARKMYAPSTLLAIREGADTKELGKEILDSTKKKEPEKEEAVEEAESFFKSPFLK